MSAQSIVALNYRFSGPPGDFSFDCPSCGKPYRIWFRVHTDAPKEGTWQIITADSWATMEGLSITPSIHNHHHGRRKACNWHGTVTNGMVHTT